MFGSGRAEDVRLRFARQHVHRRVGHLAGQGGQGHDDGHENPLQGAEQDDPGHGGQCPEKLHPADGEDGAELRRLNQVDGIDDDHRGQRGLGHLADEGRKHEQGQQGGQGGDGPGHARAGPGPTVDRGLRGAAAGGHGAEERAAGVGQPGGQQFPVRSHRRLAARREGPAGGDRLGEAHQGDPQGAGPQVLDQGEVGQDQAGQAPGKVANRGHAQVRQAEQAHAEDTGSGRDERRRRGGENAFQSHQQDEHDRAHRQGRQRGFGHGLEQGAEIVEKTVLDEMDAQQFGDLVKDNHQADAGLEAH